MKILKSKTGLRPFARANNKSRLTLFIRWWIMHKLRFVLISIVVNNPINMNVYISYHIIYTCIMFSVFHWLWRVDIVSFCTVPSKAKRKAIIIIVIIVFISNIGYISPTLIWSLFSAHVLCVSGSSVFHGHKLRNSCSECTFLLLFVSVVFILPYCHLLLFFFTATVSIPRTIFLAFCLACLVVLWRDVATLYALSPFRWVQWVGALACQKRATTRKKW